MTEEINSAPKLRLPIRLLGVVYFFRLVAGVSFISMIGIAAGPSVDSQAADPNFFVMAVCFFLAVAYFTSAHWLVKREHRGFYSAVALCALADAFFAFQVGQRAYTGEPGLTANAILLVAFLFPTYVLYSKRAYYLNS